MATWYVLINSTSGDYTSIATQPFTPPAGFEVKEFVSDIQPNVGEWWDPVAGGSQPVARTWNKVTKTFDVLLTPQVVDRVLTDLANDPVLVDMWTRLTTAQRTALRTRLSVLLGRRRYRYSTEPVDLGD